MASRKMNMPTWASPEIHPTSVLRKEAIVRASVLGRYVDVGDYSSVIRCDMGSFVTIGQRVSVNPFTHPLDWLSCHEFQYHETCFPDAAYRAIKKLPREAAGEPRISVGNDVYIGHGAVVLANLGDGAVIGANAVVTKDVEPYAIVGGNPARLIRFRFSDKIIERLLRVRWWEMPLGALSGLPFNDIERCLLALENM